MGLDSKGLRRICRKCGTEKESNKFRIRVKQSKLMIDNICMACRGKQETSRLRLEMFEALGWKCACCGEEHPYLLTLEHIKGGRGFYGRRYGHAENSRASNTYVEMRKAKKEGWDRSKWELLCMSCNHAKGHYGQCPHRTGITKEQVIEKLKEDAKGIGIDYRGLTESGKATQYRKGNPRPDLIGNKFAARKKEPPTEAVN